MIQDLKKDYIINNKGKKAFIVLFIYRTGNYVYYSNYNKWIKRLILFFLKVAEQLFVFYPFHIEIPFSCKIGAGFRIVHQHGIVINGRTEIGKNCTIHHSTTIGINELKNKNRAPILGDNVYIGAGAKIIGDIKVGNNAQIGANAVVVKNLEENMISICRQETIQ